MAALALGAISVPSSGVASSSALLSSNVKPSSKVVFARSSRTRAVPARRAITAAPYQVTLITPEGDKVVHVAKDECILDAAEKQGVSLPPQLPVGGLLLVCRSSEVRNSEPG